MSYYTLHTTPYHLYFVNLISCLRKPHEFHLQRKVFFTNPQIQNKTVPRRFCTDRNQTSYGEVVRKAEQLFMEGKIAQATKIYESILAVEFIFVMKYIE